MAMRRSPSTMRPFSSTARKRSASPVEGEAGIGAFLENALLQLGKMGGAAVDVDVGAVWTVADHGDVEVGAGENFFSDVAGGTVGTVDDDVIVAAVDAHELIEVIGVSIDGFGNLGIAADVSAAGFGDLHLALERCFDGGFLVVAQLAAAGAEEFDAVVFKWLWLAR